VWGDAERILRLAARQDDLAFRLSPWRGFWPETRRSIALHLVVYRPFAMPTGPIAFDGAVKVRAFEAKDEPRILEVLQAAFGQWPRDTQGVRASEFFRWKHMAGPFGPSILLVAEVDGEVIGFAAYMPWRFRARGQLLLAMRAVDFAVHPSHRRRGASTALTRAAVKHFSGDVAFTWSNPNEQSRPGSLKSGRREVRGLPSFVRLHGPLRETIRRGSGRGSKTPPHIRIEAQTAAEILHDDAYASRLLAWTKDPGDRLATVKDLDYLRWRYGHLEEYRAIATGTGESSSGMAIFRTRRHGSFWVSHVCELFVEHDDRRTARHLLHQVRNAAPADFISCSFSSRHHAALYGFVQSRGGTVLTTYPLQQNLVPDPTQRTSWALSRGDLELL
jgi:GNAT superfamily N-acetyltransferase